MSHNQTTHPALAVFDENSIASRLNRAKSATLGSESHPTVTSRKRAALGDLSNMPGDAKSLKPANKLVTVSTIGKNSTSAEQVQHNLSNNAATRLPAPVVSLPRKMPSKETIQAPNSANTLSNEIEATARFKKRPTTSIVTRSSISLPSSNRASTVVSTSSSRASTDESQLTSAPPSTKSSSSSALTATTVTGQKRNTETRDQSLEIQEIGSAEFASSSSVSEPNHSATTTTNITKSDDETLVQVIEQSSKDSVDTIAPTTVCVTDNGVAIKKQKINIDWDDLDQEEFDDPLMVSEYAVEIFDYLYSLETKYMPNPRYMDDQSDLDWKMRGVLVDWLVEVHTKFRLLPETLFLAVNIVDRFMSVRVITLEKVQLVGIASMIIAAKIEEVFAPSVQNYVYIADNGYEQKEVLKAEKCILEVLNFDFSYPNPMNFLRRISKADNYDVQTRTIAKYLLEIGLVDHRLMPYKTSKVAAASMYMARMMLKRGDWNDNLVHYSGDYTESDLIDVVNALLSYLTEPVTHEAFFKKYASKRFLKASIIARKWAHETVGAGANAEGW